MEEMSINELEQEALNWLIRAITAQTNVDEWEECREMFNVYCDEIKRRERLGADEHQ